MNTHTSAMRPMRRYASRRKAVLNVDLNSPFMETQTSRGSSDPVHSQASQGASASASANSRQGSQLPANDGSHSSPIDVEAIDDDVLVISSSSGNPQSRRSHLGIAVLDEDLEGLSTLAGAATEDSVTALSFNSHNKHVRTPPNTVIIDCDVYSAAGDNPKRKRVDSSCIEPKEGVPKEVTFTCPVCLDTMTEPCSTTCGHVFCQRCIKASIQAQKKCPTCRRKLTINKFHRLYLPTTTN